MGISWPVWYSYFLTWFCSFRHYINTICLVNWVNPWAFCKIQDGVQDGRQLQGFTMMDLFLQPLDRFRWSLGLFMCFPMYWIQCKYIWNHKEHITWWYFNYEAFLRHSTMHIFKKMTKITLINWTGLVWLVRVSAWQTFISNLRIFPKSEMAANSMDSPKWHPKWPPISGIHNDGPHSAASGQI